MNILNVGRDAFPESTRTSPGMKKISPLSANCDMSLMEDIVYLQRGDISLHLQLILPSHSSALLPLIIFVPGSAFFRQDVKRCIPNLSLLASKGYAVALLEYRGSEIASFPSIVLDAKAGIIFMRKNSKEYHIDPDRIFIMGDSSGGYTALMAAFTYPIASLEDEHSASLDYSVKAVVEYYAPTDFTTMNHEASTLNHIVPDSPEGLFIGRNPIEASSELVQRTIIKNYICDGRKLPPLLMFHGNADELVPFSQSCEFYEAMKKENHDVTFYNVKGAHHGGREFWSEEVLSIIDEFIKKHLQ